MKITINKIGDWDYLHEQYSRQTKPQDCYVQLNCRNGILTADYNPEIGNAVPMDVHHGHTIRWSIPALIATRANDLLDQIAPLAQRVINGYDSHWDGNNQVARYTDDAEAAINEIGDLCEYDKFSEDHDLIQYCVTGEWLYDWGQENITADTTDEQIAQMAEKLMAEAEEERMHLDGDVVECLTEWRNELRA